MRDQLEERLRAFGSVAFCLALIGIAVAFQPYASLLHQFGFGAAGLSLLFGSCAALDYGRWRLRRRLTGLPHAFGDYYRWPLMAEPEPYTRRP